MVGPTPGRTVRGALPAARPFAPRRGVPSVFGGPPIQAEKPR